LLLNNNTVYNFKNKEGYNLKNNDGYQLKNIKSNNLRKNTNYKLKNTKSINIKTNNNVNKKNNTINKTNNTINKTNNIFKNLKKLLLTKKPVTKINNIVGGLKKALLIGINYIEAPMYRLNGCINDVKNAQNLLNKYYPNCREFRILTDDSTNINLKPTKKNIIDSINWLVKDLKRGESVYFHYSGHGGLTIDYNKDEISGKDSCIYPINNGKIEMIIDDELKSILVNRIPTDCKCFAVLDSCHSGTALDLRFNINCPVQDKLIITQNNNYPKTKGSVIFLSGCLDTQYSADTVNSSNQPTGALTNALLDTWNKYGVNIKFKHMLWDIRTLLKTRGYEQIPQLSSGNSFDVNNVFKL
jgi:hypothetical protein